MYVRNRKGSNKAYEKITSINGQSNVEGVGKDNKSQAIIMPRREKTGHKLYRSLGKKRWKMAS